MASQEAASCLGQAHADVPCGLAVASQIFEELRRWPTLHCGNVDIPSTGHHRQLSTCFISVPYAGSVAVMLLSHTECAASPASSNVIPTNTSFHLHLYNGSLPVLHSAGTVTPSATFCAECACLMVWRGAHNSNSLSHCSCLAICANGVHAKEKGLTALC